GDQDRRHRPHQPLAELDEVLHQRRAAGLDLVLVGRLGAGDLLRRGHALASPAGTAAGSGGASATTAGGATTGGASGSAGTAAGAGSATGSAGFVIGFTASGLARLVAIESSTFLRSALR